MLTGSKLAVWGDPIAHSISPRLHAAAYEALGLDWEYGRARVDERAFPAALAALDDSWRGLSLTMPLKGAAFAAAGRRDRRAQLTGAANTLLLEPGAAPAAFNTDVGGLARALAEHGANRVEAGRILGAGATATSALVALAELGAARVEVRARRPEAGALLAALGERLGVEVTAVPFEVPASPADVTIATLPGGTDLGAAADPLAEAGGTLLDVVYGDWPTPLALAWQRAGQRAFSGHGMLLHQALLQVRVFVAGDPDQTLTDENSVLAAMRGALMGD